MLHGVCPRQVCLSVLACEVVTTLQGRTDQQCMGRWRRHLDPSIRRSAWGAAEDATLHAQYAQYGSRWSSIARALPGRTAQQCRARWAGGMGRSLVAGGLDRIAVGTLGSDHDAMWPHTSASHLLKVDGMALLGRVGDRG